MRFYKVIFLFFFINNSAISQELLPYVENFTKSQYNGDNQVWSAVQGTDNALYFANNNFFLRYNGAVWEKYTLPNKTIIRSVFSDKDKIYCGSYNEFGYWLRESGKMRYYSLSKDKNLFTGDSNNEEIWKIVKIDGKMYFQSFNELFIYQNDTFLQKIRIPFQISYCFTVDKKLYVASVNNGLYLYENDSFIKVTSWDSLEGNIVHAMEPSNQQLYIFTQKNGVFIDNNGILSAWNHPLNALLKKEIIITAKMIKGEKLAIGTSFRGLYVVDLKNNTYQNFSRSNAINNNSVLSIITDEEDDLWLGLDNGIAHVEINSPYKIYADNTGVLGSVYAVSTIENGYLLGSNHGVFKLENNELQVIPNSQGQVWDIYKANNQYIIGHNDGTFLYKNNEFSKVNAVSGGWKFYESAFDHKYYQANYSGIILYDHPIDFKNFRQVQSLTKPIKNIAQNKPKELWAADNYRSLFRIKFKSDFSAEKVENITALNGISNDFGVKIFNFKNTIFFYVNGVWYEFDNLSEKLVKSQVFNKNFQNISEIIPVDDNSFLVVKSKKFYVIHSTSKGFEWELIPEKYYKGKIINNDTKVFKEKNKWLINLDDGFISIENHNSKVEAKKITVEGFYDNEMISDNTTIKYNRPVVLHVLSGFFGKKLVPLFYSLNDATEVIPVTSNKISLNNLTSGKQNVTIYYHDGFQYRKLSLFSFQVARPWYFSYLMIFVYFSVLCGLFFLYYRWNKTRYLQKIRLREEELKHQNEILQLEIDAENKLKIQEYEKHILEIQVQTKASEVAGKSLSIAKQSEMIESIETILASENDLNQLKAKIKKSIKSNSINRNEWQIFEKNVMKSHEDFVQKLTEQYPKLSSKDIKLAIYLRMNLASKEIAPLMNISYRGVELHRYRLRKKLELSKETNLSNFMINL